MTPGDMQLIPQAMGRTESHLVSWAGTCLIHREVVAPLEQLCQQAQDAGYELRVASGFRSFQRQLAIWNGKVSGQRVVLDHAGQPLDMTALGEREKMLAILRWSALPGTSRHHWGTDVDVWDAASVSSDYTVQLTAQECGEDGPFFSLHCWLDQMIVGAQCDFFRPYCIDRGGIAPEPWHLSYRPVATQYEQLLQPHALRSVLEASDIALKQVVLSSLDEIFARYVRL